MVNSIIIETKEVSMCFDVRYLKSLTFEERVSYGLGIYTQCTDTENVPIGVEASLKEAFQKVDTMETPIDTSVTIEYVGEHVEPVSTSSSPYSRSSEHRQRKLLLT